MSISTPARSNRPAWTSVICPAAVLSMAIGVPAAAQTNYYVAPCGDDTWTGTSSNCSAPHGPKRTIQAAIDAAVDGDEIVVGAARYNEAIDFDGKAVYLRCVDGADTTIIDATGLDTPVVTCASDEPGTTIEGVTITGGMGLLDPDGYTRRGGGVYNHNGTLTLIGCTIADNVIALERDEAGYGAGLYNEGGQLTLTQCTFRGNSAHVGSGGGLFSEGGSLVLTNCTFSGNSVRSINAVPRYGGGLYINNATATLIDCTFHANVAHAFWTAGGGIFCSSSSLTLDDCTFEGNGADFGGGMVIVDSSPTLTNCTFTGNCASVGGGMSSSRSNPMLANCTFISNCAESASAMETWDSSPTLTNCSFAANWTFGEETVFIGGDGVPTFTSCILWNPSSSGPEINGIAVVAYSNVRDGHQGTGNIDEDPLFVGPDVGIFSLSAWSPCIDAGDNTAVPDGIVTDLAGNPRFVDDPWTDDTGVPGGAGGDKVVDMGAYEFQGASCSADFNADGVVDTRDVLAFLNAWTGQEGAADCDGNGVIDSRDVLCFLNLWAAGC